ncbi:MAG: hypothetical protein ACRC8S_19835 [Fimbriiglobus sp.]
MTVDESQSNNPDSPPPNSGIEFGGEIVARRFYLSGFGHFKTSRNPQLQIEVLIPRKSDHRGLSMSILKSPGKPDFLTAEELRKLDQNPDQTHRSSSRVFGIRAEIFLSNDIEILPDPTDEDPGHVLIPSFSYSSYCSDKNNLRVVFAKLLKEAALLTPILIEE